MLLSELTPGVLCTDVYGTWRVLSMAGRFVFAEHVATGYRTWLIPSDLHPVDPEVVV